MTQLLTEQITDLLRRTGAAHGVYEETELNGVYDQDWATWYAAWALDHGLNTLLPSDFSADELTPLLVAINNAHQKSTTGETWAQFTARWLVEKY